MKKSNNSILIWLTIVLLSIIAQVILGGYVRLTDSGLSMYDWNVVTGVIPPVTQDTWEQTFANYKKTPEYKKINVGMTLEEYKLIYLREYNHRILGRLTGLLYVIPLFFFLFMGRFRWRQSKVYLLIGLLYAGQGIMGWYMVKSGLVDQPDVSHYRLAAHFILALLIYALVLWKLLDTACGDKIFSFQRTAKQSFRLLLVFLVLFTFQVLYGAFAAGLKAGFVSDTFPFMFGYLFPPNLFIAEIPGLLDLFSNAVTIHFIHRWFAFVLLGFSIYLFFKIKKEAKFSVLLPLVVLMQILLGLAVILLHVPLSIALIHQFGGLVILSVSVYLLHNCIHTSTSSV